MAKAKVAKPALTGSGELKWSHPDKRLWEYTDDTTYLRITQVGGSDDVRFYCYKDKKILGSEPTLAAAMELCAKGEKKVIAEDDLAIPTDLLLTPEQRACARSKASATTVADNKERRDWRKPKGMGWEEWDAVQAKAKAELEAAKPSAAQPQPKAPLAQPSKSRKNVGTIAEQGLLTAHHFAAKLGCEAKMVRRALRTTKAISKPDCGWAFPASQEAAVLAVVGAWLKGHKGTSEAEKPTSEPAQAAAPYAELKKAGKLRSAPVAMPKLAKRRAKVAK